jgi:membrane protein YqaA with SNARE-associated domain
MIYWLCIAFGLAFVLAVFPFGSVELFLIGLAIQRPDIPWLALGAVVATGQVFGKLVHYYAARGVLRLPALARVGARATPENGRARWRSRLAATMATATDKARERPGWLHTVFATSTLIGLPPFGATTVLAGFVEMRVSTFLMVALSARFIRYSALAAAPTVVEGLLF